MLQNLCNDALGILVEFLATRNINKINVMHINLRFEKQIVQKLSIGFLGKYLYFGN